MVPRATFCQPQVASFGYTEAQARAAGYEVKIAKFPFQGVGKAIAMGDYSGFVKLVTDAKYGEILGAHLIGAEVSELLPELTLAHAMELTAQEVAHNIHIHPTLGEAVMEAAEGVEGNSIHI
jgi:dihydrolipoamide dehydrogenase